MMLLKSRTRTGKETAVPATDEGYTWRQLESRTFGWDDAALVGEGERVVRAILAHHAVPMFSAVFPDVDLEHYLVGYWSAPDSKLPLDRRQMKPGDDYTGPRRRYDDLYC